MKFLNKNVVIASAVVLSLAGCAGGKSKSDSLAIVEKPVIEVSFASGKIARWDGQSEIVNNQVMANGIGYIEKLALHLVQEKSMLLGAAYARTEFACSDEKRNCVLVPKTLHTATADNICHVEKVGAICSITIGSSKVVIRRIN